MVHAINWRDFESVFNHVQMLNCKERQIIFWDTQARSYQVAKATQLAHVSALGFNIVAFVGGSYAADALEGGTDNGKAKA